MTILLLASASSQVINGSVPSLVLFFSIAIVYIVIVSH
jgi:hypothetical protein